MKDDKIRLALIGLGHIGKLHATILSQHRLAELVAVSDVNPSLKTSFESEHCAFFNSIDSLLASSLNFDVVSIATPNGLHEQHALSALEAGKHVVIEKPMSLTAAGCKKIIDAAAQRQLQVFCIMQNRHAPVSGWLKGLLEANLLGKIYMVNISCYWNRDNSYYTPGSWHGTKNMDGGTLYTQFSHFIDIMFWLFGDITNIQGRFANFNHDNLIEFEDSGVVQFDFVNGGVGNLAYSTSCWNKNLESSITVIAENGCVKIGGQYMNEVEYCHVKNYTMPELPPANPPNDYRPYKGFATNHHYIFENVIDVLKGRSPITINALEGLKVVEIIERIYNLKK